MVTACYGWLQVVTDGYLWLPVVTGGFEWLRGFLGLWPGEGQWHQDLLIY